MSDARPTGSGAWSGGPRARGPAWRVRWARATCLLLLCCLPAAAAGQDHVAPSPREVEAAFLRNFAHYLSWPSEAFADARSPWRVCLLGDGAFEEVLRRTFAGRTEQGRSFEVVRAESATGLPQCQIAVVLLASSEQRRAALAVLSRRPILTVGDAPGFLEEGGIIRFQVSDHVEFAINLDEAHAASLVIQTKVLEVAREVVEGGVVRRR
jgi:hypothetical protein